jgi:hypothetical protein
VASQNQFQRSASVTQRQPFSDTASVASSSSSIKNVTPGGSSEYVDHLDANGHVVLDDSTPDAAIEELFQHQAAAVQQQISLQQQHQLSEFISRGDFNTASGVRNSSHVVNETAVQNRVGLSF